MLIGVCALVWSNVVAECSVEHFTTGASQSSVYSMPQSNKFIVYFSILPEMAFCQAGLAPVICII